MRKRFLVNGIFLAIFGKLHKPRCFARRGLDSGVLIGLVTSDEYSQMHFPTYDKL